MSVNCDRCSTKGGSLDGYENFLGLVLCHECAEEKRNEK